MNKKNSHIISEEVRLVKYILDLVHINVLVETLFLPLK